VFISGDLTPVFESFIMSYTYNGQQIPIMQPVHSISVNNNRMVINHALGKSDVAFSNSSDFKAFLCWLSEN
jgi:hypothetical protein|tara:strand:- start:33 stop:245 length:213 start_codon:yes stop_codon:yes gene_type:complete